MRQAVIDTNVLVAALKSRRGKSFELLQRMFAGAFCPVISVPLIFEYEALLTKLYVPQLYSKAEIAGFVDRICGIAKQQEIYYLWRPLLKDPYDDHILELALASGCDIIVTYNTKDFENVDTLGIQVMEPNKFICSLEGK